MHPIEEAIPRLPQQPGVYLMKGESGKVLYVGKAKNLRARLRSYVGAGADAQPKVRFLMAKVKDLEHIVTKTEKEALLLENTLIKRYRPRYNVNLRDDKTYLHILVDRNHPFPRFVPVRRPKPHAGQILFGPYSSAAAMRDTLRQIHKMYPLRTCTDREFQTRKRPCLQHQMGRCSGACVGRISTAKYKEMVDQAILILKGKRDEVLRILETEMKEASENMRFEEAAEIRDRIRGMRLTMERQRVVGSRGEDRDLIGLVEEGGRVQISLLMIREGCLVESRGFPFSETVIPAAELLRSFLLQYYSQAGRSIPPEILLPLELEDREAIEGILSELREGPCSLKTPKRGEKKQLLSLADLNARSLYEEQVRDDRRRLAVLQEVQRRLAMEKPPNRIECFDISNLHGELAVGSRVVFQEGAPHPDGYRRYRIRVPKGSDDYGMMYEILRRRFGSEEERQTLPDLLLIDGGRGHLGVALRTLEELGIRGVRAAAIAKMRRHGSEKGESAGGGESLPDRVFLPGRSNPVRFPPHSRGLHLLQRVRDEAHRFAVTYHRRLRSREMARSELDGIPGVGPRRKKALLDAMGDLDRIREATIQELRAVAGMSEKAARSIRNRFRKGQEAEPGMDLPSRSLPPTENKEP
jgi:excinuclease ABC subunit C